MDDQHLRDAARAMARHRRAGQPLGPLPRPPLDQRQAYALQGALHRELTDAGHGQVVGFKIGCTTEVMQQYLRIAHPCAGGVFDSSVFHGHARLRPSDYQRVGVECEVAVRLGRDVTADDCASRSALEATVGEVMAAVEIVDDRYADFASLGAMTLIADDFFGAGCVLGEPNSDPASLDLDALAGRMWVNETLVGEGVGADIMGHPLSALAWLAELRLGLGECLRAGEIVLLGSLVKTAWLNAGDNVRISIEGLGSVSLSLDR